MSPVFFLLVVLAGCTTTAREELSPHPVISDSVAISEVLRWVENDRDGPVHADPRPLSPSFDPFEMMDTAFDLTERDLEEVESALLATRERSIVALGFPTADAIQDFACAWGNLSIPDESYYRVRRERGCDRITPYNTVIMTRPQTTLESQVAFEDSLAEKRLREGQAVVVRVLILQAEPDAGSTETDDVVIGIGLSGKPQVLTTRGLLITE